MVPRFRNVGLVNSFPGLLWIRMHTSYHISIQISSQADPRILGQEVVNVVPESEEFLLFLGQLLLHDVKILRA